MAVVHAQGKLSLQPAVGSRLTYAAAELGRYPDQRSHNMSDAIPAAELSVEPTGHRTHGKCPDCGGLEQTIWGYIHHEGSTRAVYYVRWTVGRPTHDLVWMVSWGWWGDESLAAGRRSVGLRFRPRNATPSFMVVDAVETPWGCQPKPETFGSYLRREEVVDSSLATQVYACLDAVLENDSRLRRFLSRGEGVDGFIQVQRGWGPFRRFDWRRAAG